MLIGTSMEVGSLLDIGYRLLDKLETGALIT
jgi:hypothetical protein